MHLKRWLTSILAVPIIAWIYFGPLPAFAGLIAVVAIPSMWEYYYILFRGEKRRILTPIPLAGAVLGLSIIGAAAFSRLDLIIMIAWAVLVISAVSSMPGFGREGQKLLDLVAAQVQFIIYIPISLAFLVLLRAQPDGVVWIFFLVFVVFLGDVGAYYVGTYFGRHKLIPDVSPGKTVEGALGGLGANIVTGVIFKSLFLPEAGMGLIILFVVVIGIVGQLGDLFESEMKRAAKIKDSGGILPGHGGMLDRIDALLFAAPVAYIFKIYVF